MVTKRVHKRQMLLADNEHVRQCLLSALARAAIETRVKEQPACFPPSEAGGWRFPVASSAPSLLGWSTRKGGPIFCGSTRCTWPDALGEPSNIALGDERHDGVQIGLPLTQNSIYQDMFLGTVRKAAIRTILGYSCPFEVLK